MSDCEKFAGRQRDLCMGVGLDGRRDPPLYAVKAFREQHGITGNPQTHLQSPLTTIERAASFVKAGVEYVATGKLLSEEQIAERMAICNTCEHLKNGMCDLCGCLCNRDKVFKNKLANPNVQCPHKPPKWGPVNE